MGKLVGMSRSGTAGGILVCALCCGMAFAQSAPSAASGRKFEVVSIRENPAKEFAPGGPTPDGYRLTDMPLILLLWTAYVPQSRDFQTYSPENILGAPKWVMDKSYDIDARISDADRADWQDPKKQPVMLREMLQAMLADRFKLVVHREMKEMPVYNLVVAKGGPKFHVATGEHPADATALPDGGGFIGHGGGTFRYYDAPIKTLATMLSGVWSGRPVLDRTGLTGRYDITLGTFRVGGIGPDTNASPGSDSPTVFSAVGDLGLKLEPAKGEVEMLVIDRIEEPTAN
jgi:uncharacterized protein (TIGR03435 family)